MINLLRACLFLSALSLLGCAATYSAKPITATVVDAETAEPLEGVNVVAHWLMHDPNWRSAGDLELMEAVTDMEGKFHIPGWGPKAIPRDLPRGTRLGNDDPGMILFKSGYKVAGLSNMSPPNRLRPENDIPVRYSDWDGKVIKLEKFKGDLQFYGPSVTFGSGIQCPWKKVPRFFVALMQERARLDRLAVRSVLPTLGHLENSFRNSDCGSAEEFFRAYMPWTQGFAR